MELVILIFGALIIAAGIGMLIKPDFLFDFLKRESNNTMLHILAIIIRLLIGFLLIYYSEMSDFPVIMETIGWFAIIAALALLLIGRKNFQKLIDWAVTFLKPYRFIGALLAIVFGAFLIYGFR